MWKNADITYVSGKRAVCIEIVRYYSKELKRVTAFNLFTLLHADINQSEVEDSFQLASDWIDSAWKNIDKWKPATILGCLLYLPFHTKSLQYHDYMSSGTVNTGFTNGPKKFGPFNGVVVLTTVFFVQENLW